MNKYISEHCNINKDSMEWAILKTSAYFKEEYRKKQAETEIVDSYICCMNVICNQIENEFIEGGYILKEYSLCIPFLYICRHTIELVLKKSIENKINGVRTGHNISRLWKECKNEYKGKNLKAYDELMEAIDILDDDGEKFRYIKDKFGNEFENKPIFLNTELIRKDINKLKNELL